MGRGGGTAFGARCAPRNRGTDRERVQVPGRAARGLQYDAGVKPEIQDAELRAKALTHASFDGDRNNERLEFLGDTVLDLLVAEELFVRRPDASEGEMSTAKAWLVSRKTLAAAARRLGLWEEAHIGRSLDPEHLPSSVHANLFEAVLGALYLDQGIDAARTFVRTALADELKRAVEDGVEQDHKQRLQEWAQAHHGAPPVYHLVEQSGDYDRIAFRMQAEIAGRAYPTAWGRSRKEAERGAALEALLVIAAESDA